MRSRSIRIRTLCWLLGTLHVHRVLLCARRDAAGARAAADGHGGLLPDHARADVRLGTQSTHTLTLSCSHCSTQEDEQELLALLFLSNLPILSSTPYAIHLASSFSYPQY